MINDDNTPANGAIIVDDNGIVLGGNGRTMTLHYVIKQYPKSFHAYYELLKKKAKGFGIETSQISNIEYPVLVRVISLEKKKNCNYYSRIFNENMNNKLDETDLAVSYVKSLGNDRILAIAKQIAGAIKETKYWGKTSLKEVMNEKSVLPFLLNILKDAKLINHTNYSTYIYNEKKKELLTESAVPLVRNMFYAMIFEDRKTIQFAKANSNIKVEYIFGNLMEIKAMDGVYNIIPQLKLAIAKIALNQGSGDLKATADDIYEQENMFGEWQVKYIEYLCMRLLELTDREQQQKVLLRYVSLERNLRNGFWEQKGSEVNPEKLLEMAFDEAKVKYILANTGNLSDKKKRTIKKPKNRTIKQNQSVLQKALNWIKQDIQRFFN